MTCVSSYCAYATPEQVRESRGEVEGKKKTDITVLLMASMTSLTLPWPGLGSLKWLVKHRNIDSITLGKHAATAPCCVGWLAGRFSSSPGHPAPFPLTAP